MRGLTERERECLIRWQHEGWCGDEPMSLVEEKISERLERRGLVREVWYPDPQGGDEWAHVETTPLGFVALRLDAVARNYTVSALSSSQEKP